MMMCHSKNWSGFRIKPACVSERVFTTNERCLKNSRMNFLIKVNGVVI